MNQTNTTTKEVKRMSIEQHMKFIMDTIDSSLNKDHLKACDELVKGFCNIHRESDKAPYMKASLDGMIVFKEYQLEKTEER